jgi:hypothetical protein
MSDEDLKVDNSDRDTASDRSSERGAERSERDSERGDSRELSGGRRDRSRELLREELQKGFDAEARKADADDDRRHWEPANRAAREAKEATKERKTTDRDAADAAPAATGAETAASVDVASPPSSWTADAKKEWSKTPPAVRAMVHKREQDSARGVEQLKQKYAQEDAVWANYEPVLKQFSKSRSETVQQLMSWHQALQANPVQAFDALARSHGHDLQAIAQAARGGQQQATQQQAAQQQLDPVDQRLMPYLQHFEQRIGSIQQTFEQREHEAGVARANAVLDEFKKTRPHFERVRQKMASLIASQTVPLRPDGSVPLEEAYNAAVRMDDELGEQLIAERIAAERKAAREQASKARYASSSLSPAAPGSGSLAGKKPTRGRSVRQSLEEVIDEMRS